MIIYYAHPMLYYGTELEQQDIALLSERGQVINPNSTSFQAEATRAKAQGQSPMTPFLQAVRHSSLVAWRPFPNGKIGAGIAAEMLEGIAHGKPLFNLQTLNDTSFSSNDILSIEETRTYLKSLRSK